MDRKVIIGLAKVEEGEEEKNRTPIILLFCCDNTIQAMRRYEGRGRAKGIFRSFFLHSDISNQKRELTIHF